MLGFGPVATIPVAGSPLGVVAGNLWVLDTGLITLSGGVLTMLQERHMTMETGTVQLTGGDAALTRQLQFGMYTGQITLTGQLTRIYKSSYQYGDTEVIRVAPEVRTSHILSEPRTVYVGAKPSSGLVSEDHEDTLEPRLRRT